MGSTPRILVLTHFCPGIYILHTPVHRDILCVMLVALVPLPSCPYKQVSIFSARTPVVREASYVANFLRLVMPFTCGWRNQSVYLSMGCHDLGPA